MSSLSRIKLSTTEKGRLVSFLLNAELLNDSGAKSVRPFVFPLFVILYD